MSFSKKKTIISTVIGVLVVSLFAATLFYLVPNNSHISSVVFALSSNDYPVPRGTVYSLEFSWNVTLLNNTSWPQPDNWPAGYLPSSGGLNSTDIQQIQFTPLPAYFGDVGISEPFLCTFQFDHNYQISTEVTGETPLDLGMLNVINDTMSSWSASTQSTGGSDYVKEAQSPNFTVPELNYTYQVNSTGYWSSATPPLYWGAVNWTMSIDQIQSILANTNDTVNIAFNLNLNDIVYYQLTTASGTQTGTASVQYSGPWGTLQLFHDGDQLLGLQYDFSNVGLTMSVQS